jgi:hypothetical protein
MDLYGLCLATGDPNLSSWQSYDKALHCFEHGRLQEAADNLATIDPAITKIPSRFLAEHIERELARQNRRRSTDKGSETPRGVITLNSK